MPTPSTRRCTDTSAFNLASTASGIRARTTSECPASSIWQVSGRLKCRDGRAGQAQVNVVRPVPCQGLVRPDRVVFDAVVLSSFGEHDGVVDLVDVEPLVFQRAEPAFA